MVSLPATLHGRNEAAIYARTSGYVRSWKKDLGDTVRRGELLVQIDTPEVDQDLAQARAALAQVQARLALAASSQARWEGLRAGNAVSQQELDERRAALQQAQADLAAAQANAERLQRLHDFGRVTAPFDGVVVRRLVNVGALVTAGSQSTTQPLYELAETGELKLTVGVPQAYAADVQVGTAVHVRLPEQPRARYVGEVTRISGGLDATTRTLQAEVRVPDQGGLLRPGTYVEAGLQLKGATQAMLLPPNALQFRQDGPRVAVVDAKGLVQWRALQLGRDLGKQVEVLAGITPQDRVVLNPADALQDGETVRVQPTPPTATAAPKGERRAGG